jgi:signal transduction histidine kinase
MRLFTKYARVNFMALLCVLFLGSAFYYYIIRFVLIDQLDDTLKVEEQEIQDFVSKKGALPEPSHYRDQSVFFRETDQVVKRKFMSFRLHGHFRQLLFPVNVKGQNYVATVSKSQREADKLIGLIVLITGGVLLLLLLVLFMLNRFFLQKLWQPFYNTLAFIKQFNLTNKRSLPNQVTEIDEFKELGIAVTDMTGKVLQDYESLKNFSDNASHEMQTPLAIINSRLDLMIQDQELNEKQMKQLQGIYDATGRLTKLNQSLLLLTKIENNQFAEAQSVQLDDLIKKKLIQFDELIVASHLQVRLESTPASVLMNDYLADILINNLLSNAIRHNHPHGQIHIRLGSASLMVSNTSSPLDFNPSGIFDRFQKSSSSPGVGLGLAIVKQICDNYHFSVTYAYEGEMHRFAIQF